MVGYAPYEANPPLSGLDTKTSLHVMWLAPFANAEAIERYELQVDGRSVSSVTAQYIYSGLIPGTSHNFSVRAVNSLGAGGWSPSVDFSTDNDVPGKPSVAPSLLASNETTLVVGVGTASYTGGLAVDHYEVSCDAGEALATCNGTVALAAGGMELVLADRRLDLTYSIRARAVNALGAGAWSEYLIVQSNLVSLPPSPLDLQVDGASVLAHSFSISWRMPSSVSVLQYPVQSYRLKLVSTDENGAQVTEQKDIAKSSECKSTCTALISDVRPFTSYSLQLSAVNSVGQGLASLHQSVTTIASVPDAVGSLSVNVSSGSSLSVSWTLPAANGSPLTSITLDVCDATTATCVQQVESASSTSTAVTSLTEGRNYTVAAVAANSIGSGLSTSADGVYTTPYVPMVGYAPYEANPPLSGLNTKTSLHVMWLAPFANAEAIERYELQVDGGIVSVPIGSGAAQYIYSGLIPGTSHNFSVRAVNSLGAGGWSPSVDFSTNASVPGKPLSLQTQVLSSSIKVLLQPAAYSGGFPITSYELYSHTSVPGSEWALEATTSLVEERTFDVNRARLDINYFFRARAVNALGAGAWSDGGDVASVQSEVKDLPSTPQSLSLVGGTITHNSLALRWTMPGGNTSSSVTYYRLKLTVTNTSAVSYVDVVLPGSAACTSGCEATVASGLQPATAYDLQLSAVNSVGQSLASLPVVQVVTMATVPGAVGALFVTVSSGSSLAMSWSLPAANGAPLTSITLDVCDVTTTTCVQQVESASSTSTAVTSLTEGRNYTVVAMAANSIGSGLSTSADGVYTTPSTPMVGYAPYEANPPLSGLNTKTSLHVMWLAPFANAEAIERYELQVDGGSVSSVTAQYIYSGLIPGTSHSFLCPRGEQPRSWRLVAVGRLFDG